MRQFNNRVLLLLLLLVSCASAQEHLRKGIAFYEQKEWAQAEAFFAEELRRTPDALLPCHYLAASLLEQGKYRQAYTVLTAGVKKHPGEKALLANYLTAGIQLRRYEPLTTALAFLQQHPGDKEISSLAASAFLRQAEDSRAAGNYGAATALALKARAYNPGDERSAAVLVYALLGGGDGTAALREAKTAVQRFPGSRQVRAAYIAALSYSQEYEEALRQAVNAAPNFRDDIDFNLQLLMLYRANYKVKEAEALAAELLRRFTSVERVYDGAIRYYESVNSKTAVRGLLEKKIRVFGRETAFRLEIARSYEEELYWDSARTVYNGLLATAESDSISYRVALTYAREGKTDTAALQLRKLAAQHPGYYKAHSALCALYKKAGDGANMLAASDAMLQSFPGDFWATVFYSQALLSAKRFADARVPAKAAALQRRNSPYPQDVLGDIYFSTQDAGQALIAAKLCTRNSLLRAKEAEQELSILVQQLQQGKPTGDEGRGENLRDEMQDLKYIFRKHTARAALLQPAVAQKEMLLSLLAAFPGNALVLTELGGYYSALREVDSALLYYRAALAKMPMLAEAHYAVGELQYSRADYRGAMQSYRRAITADTLLSAAYDKLIAAALQCGEGGALADDWMRIYRTNRGNAALRERLLELLHKLNRFTEAANLIKEGKP